MVLYEFRDETKLDYLAKEISKDRFQDLDAEKSTKIRVLTTISAFYMARAIHETNDKIREDLFREVRAFFNKSDKVEISEKITFTLKGFYYFFQNEIKQSSEYFDNAKETDSNFVPCILGRACLEFAKKKYNEAKDLFRTALKMNPNGPYQMRLGLSLCYYQLEEYQLAKIGFRSVTARNPQCVEAKIGLAIIAKKQGNLEDYYETLCDIYRLEPQNYLLNVYLAEHYFYKKDFERARKLITEGLKKIDQHVLISKPEKRTPAIRVDVCMIKSKYYYMLGFMSHETDEKLDSALRFYKQAVDTNPDNSAAHFGLGQVYLANKSYDESIKHFEAIVSHQSELESNDCFRIMAYIHSRRGKKPLAKKYYELALKYNPQDIELLIEFATYLESVEIKEALPIYAKIMGLIDSNPGIQVKSELYNNYAVTLIKNKKFLDAEKQINKGFAENKEQDVTLNYFLRFNRGILYEERGLFDKAIEEYKSLVQMNPLFQDPLIRLAQIYFNKGDIPLGIELCDQARKTVTAASRLNRVDVPFCLKANYQLEDNEYEKCMATLSTLDQVINFEDPYAVLTKARCLYLRSVSGRGDPLEQKRLLKEAAECCRKVLKKPEEENNMYAGMIIAAIFGERGRSKDCTDILNTCQEAQPNNPKVLFNLALIEYFKQHYEKSLTILASYHQKHQDSFNESVEILFAINNLMYKNYKDAFKHFQKMQMMYPNNYAYVYNTATFMHEYVKSMFKQNKREQQQIETCLKYIKTSKRIFNSLARNIQTRTENTYKYPEVWSEAKKKRVQAGYFTLWKGIEGNRFYMRENESKYIENIQTDKSRLEEENMSKDQRRKIIDELAYNRIRDEQMVKHRRQQEEAELERRAKVEMQMADELNRDILISKRQNEQKKKSQRQRKADILEDEHGNMPLQNFGLGLDDQEQNFTDMQARVNPTRKSKAPRVAAEKGGEKKRLKKKVNVDTKDDSDEMLDFVSEEDVEPVQPVGRKGYDPGADDEDGDGSDVAERLQDLDEEETGEPEKRTDVNFSGGDETENTF